MHYILRTVLFSVLIVANLTACRKAQEESAEAARETITEMKASTIDAANEAAAQAERVANDMQKQQMMLARLFQGLKQRINNTAFNIKVHL